MKSPSSVQKYWRCLTCWSSSTCSSSFCASRSIAYGAFLILFASAVAGQCSTRFVDNCFNSAFLFIRFSSTSLTAKMDDLILSTSDFVMTLAIFASNFSFSENVLDSGRRSKSSQFYPVNLCEKAVSITCRMQN